MLTQTNNEICSPTDGDPADMAQTVPAPLYAAQRTQPPPAPQPCDAPAQDPGELQFAPFASLCTSCSTVDKLIGAVLSLLAQHDYRRMPREAFSSNVLYEHAVKTARDHKNHAMQMLRAIGTMADFDCKHIFMACEPPLVMNNNQGEYSIGAIGNGMQSNHVTLYVLRMLTRALNLHWSQLGVDPHEAAPAVMAAETAQSYF